MKKGMTFVMTFKQTEMGCGFAPDNELFGRKDGP